MTDPKKLELEKKKLEAEIEEIKSRNELHKKEIEHGAKNVLERRLRSLFGIGIAGTAVISGVLTIWINSCNYLDQREEQTKFKVTGDVINLVKTLGSEDKPTVENTVLLLPSYGKFAVPILLLNIERGIAFEATISSLKIHNAETIVIKFIYP